MASASMPLEVLRPAVALVPWALALCSAVLARDRNRRAGAALATAWNAVVLTAVNVLAVRLGWWSFGTSEHPVLGTTWSGVPIDVMVGWAVLWGAVPLLLGAVISPMTTGSVLVVADMITMGSLSPLVVLSPQWWWGEAVAVTVALVPGLVIGELTARGRAVRVRSSLQTLLFTAILAWAVPSAALAFAGRSWPAALESWPRAVLYLLIQFGLLIAIVAHRAVAEFAAHGGTPFPWDPPARLVCTGPYAYLANPMQTAAVLILIIEAAALLEWRLAAAAVVATAFAWGIATRHEHGELGTRFGASWRDYRSEVRDWLPRRQPFLGNGAAQLWVSATCPVCAPTGQWFASRAPNSLHVRAAEDHPAGIQRVRYVRGEPGSDCVESANGIAAIGRGLEHLGFGWALVGWLLRAPIIGAVIQVVFDAIGGGPREIGKPRPNR